MSKQNISHNQFVTNALPTAAIYRRQRIQPISMILSLAKICLTQATKI